MSLKVRFTGKLRSRLTERYKMYAAEEEGDQAQLAYNTLSRQKTNVVVESEEEARALIQALDKFHGPGAARAVTWANGSIRTVAERVTKEVREGIDDL